MRRFMNDKDYKTTRLQDYKLRVLTFVISLLSLAFVVSSCSTEKDLGRNNIKTLSANHLIREIEDNQFEFENLEAKIGVNLKGSDNLGLKGQIRMQKDSVIWISLSLKVGIEIGRVMITNDSIKYINRSNKTYLVESIDNFKEEFPIDLSLQNLQDILIGNDSQLRNSDKNRVFVENNNYVLEITENDYNLIKNVIVSPENFKINRLEFKDFYYKQNGIQIQYDAFQNIDGQLMPTKIVFDDNMSARPLNYNIHVEINYSDIKKGEKLDFPFNISSKFEQILIW